MNTEIHQIPEKLNANLTTWARQLNLCYSEDAEISVVVYRLTERFIRDGCAHTVHDWRLYRTKQLGICLSCRMAPLNTNQLFSKFTKAHCASARVSWYLIISSQLGMCLLLVDNVFFVVAWKDPSVFLINPVMSRLQMLKRSFELWSLAWQPSCLNPPPCPPPLKLKSGHKHLK